MATPPRRSVTRDELEKAIEDSEQRLVNRFDQRLKDSERVLTWRMIGVVSAGTFASGIIGSLVAAPDRTQAAVSALGNLLS